VGVAESSEQVATADGCGIVVKGLPSTKSAFNISVFSMHPYRAAAFDITGCNHPPLHPVLSIGMHGKKVVQCLRTANSLELTKYYCVNCCCIAVTMPIKLNSYAVWSASERVASVWLPLNSTFFCLAEILSHVIL